MNILITGIDGFVGRYLSRELTASGYTVRGIDRRSGSPDVIAADITDGKNLEAWVRETSPDAVFHLAAVAETGSRNVQLMYDINFQGTLNLLNACVNLEKIPRFIFISSSQVYGNVAEDQLPVDELFPVKPVNHYGASKAAGEILVRAFNAEYGLEYVIIRPFNHTGPGQSDGFVVPKIVNAFKRGDNSIELGNIDTIRDFSDVRDVVTGYAGIIENFHNGEIYNIASGEGIRIADVIGTLEGISGRKVTIIKKERLVRKNEIGSIIGNAEKISRDTGWSRRIDFEETLRIMLKGPIVTQT